MRAAFATGSQRYVSLQGRTPLPHVRTKMGRAVAVPGTRRPYTRLSTTMWPAGAGDDKDTTGGTMLHGSQADGPVPLESPEVVIQKLAWGDMHGGFETYNPECHVAPLLKGLPDDACQCPHWGYLITGAVHVRYTDGTEEVTGAGAVFYWAAGHTAWVEQDTAFIDFSPEKEHKKVTEHIAHKMGQSA